MSPVSGRLGRDILALLLAWTGGCAAPGPREAARPPRDSTPSPAPDTAATPAPRPAGFLAVPIDSGAPFRRLVTRLGPERLTLFLKLNRVDLAHVRAGDTLMLPADSTADQLALAPFPTRLPALDSVPKLLAVSLRIQAIAAYDSGRLVLWGPTSTGKRATPTPAGLFHANWKARETRSTENEEWLLRWYVNIHNQRGLSLHEYDLPGRPASHACVRLLDPDAGWIYRWVDQWTLRRDGRTILAYGTPVLIFGEYHWDSLPPWRRLAEDPLAATLRPAEIDRALTPHLATILARLPAADTAGRR